MQHKIIRFVVRIASQLVPLRTARWAANMFFTPRRFLPHQSEVLPVPDKEEAIDGAYIRRWGEETDCVFLLHGWEGRYSQFYALLPVLRLAGFSVLTIDPPGHGNAFGKRSNPRLFAEALLSAAEHVGQPTAVIGHSMGGAAVMLAIRNGLKPRSAVLISSPSSLRSVIAAFGGFIGLSDRSATFLRQQIESEVGLSLEEVEVATLANGGCRPPALIIHDAADIRIPVNHAEKINAHWPQATLSLTSGLGHQRILTDANVVNTISNYVLRFATVSAAA